MSDKVELGEKLQAVDENVTELWDALDADQQKALKQEFYILNRYVSSVGVPYKPFHKGKKNPTQEEKENYVIKVNEYFNKHWNLLQKHPKLMWHLLCMCNYDGSTQYFHEWIGFKKKTGSNKKIKFLSEIYPETKMDEIELMAELATDKDLKELARKHGFDEATIAKKLK